MKKLTLVLFLLVINISFPQNSIDSTNTNKVEEPIEKPDLNKIENDLDKLKTQLDSYESGLNKTLLLFTILITVGAAVSIWSQFKSEKRESKSFKLSLESFEQSKADSISNKIRENSIFEESQKTLTLVNETLLLATEASKRASKSLENRLRSTLDNLEKESLRIIEKSRAFIDDKNLTTDSDICAEIHRVGRKIEGLENNLIILEGNQISLKPYCNFIRATDSYLDELFDQAIDYIDEVLYVGETDNKLKSLAYFWKGYILNNLGKFDEAHSEFRNANQNISDSRKYELSRIELETRFFNNDNPETIVQEFESLVQLIEDDKQSDTKQILDSRKAKVKTTLGNIYYQLGVSKNNGQNNYFKKSIDIFSSLLDLNMEKLAENDIVDTIKRNKNRDKLKWTIFGLAESMYQDDYKKDIAIDIFKQVVYHAAENEFLNREEKRTKVLAKMTQLICDLRVNESQTRIMQTKSLVESALGGVDKRLTIYSQLQRKNVNRDVFRNDLENLLDKIDTNSDNS